MGLPFFIFNKIVSNASFTEQAFWYRIEPNRCTEVISVDFKEKIIRMLDSLPLWELEYLYYFILEMKKRRGD